MIDTAGRSFVVGIPGGIGQEDLLRLDTAGVRWMGNYDVLRGGWGDDLDATPWTVRNVVRVKASDAGAAVRRVAEALRRPELADAMDATDVG